MLLSILTAATALMVSIHSKMLCDERIPMQITFLRHILNHPWGGRQISFSFEGCPGQGLLRFTGSPGYIYLPHNIFLDIINDTGIIPAFFLLITGSTILILAGRHFLKVARTRKWDMGQSIRFGLIIAVICQSMFQPLLYSDQMLFTASFLLTGVLMAEFTLSN